jgi:ABC-type phosphonate transport system ATPase subunit
MSAVLHAAGLTKFYGRERGVVDLDFEVGRGEVFGWSPQLSRRHCSTAGIWPSRAAP